MTRLCLMERQRMNQADGDDRQQPDDEDERGSRNARALSPSPRRFNKVMTARIPRQIGTVAEVRGKRRGQAPTPAAIDTATVSV